MAYEEKAKQMMDFRMLVLTSIITALSFVVGLFWRDAIAATIEEIIPEGEGLLYKYYAAIIVTIIVVIFVFVLIRANRLAEKHLEDIIKDDKKKRRKKRRK